jgi:hexosaminidase
MKLVNTTFEDPYVHFGGDEVLAVCWDLKPSIKKWMLENDVATYKDLEAGYRKRQKSLWRNISPTKKTIYWANEVLNLPLEDDDVVHWWGASIDVHRLAGKPNEVILSTNDIAYIDKGFGNRNGITYGNYIKWRDIYKFEPRVEGVKVIGGETCMWSELSNIHTHEQKIWIRTSVLAERLWNDGVDIKTQLLTITERLQAHAERMRARGFKVSPVTVQICEEDPSICFS